MIPVIIPFFGSEDQLNKCKQHLSDQTVTVDIFVRDNNTDNRYFTAALNEGIANYLDSDCKYMIVLNQDMYLKPNAVEEMIKFMDNHPECGIAMPLQLSCNNPEIVICAGGTQAFPHGIHLHGNLSDFAEDKMIHWANGACMILRKEMIRQIGLMDENFVLIGSDSDYSFTARSRGWQIWAIASARGTHEHGVTSTTTDPAIEAIKIHDMYYFGMKWLNGNLYRDLADNGHMQTPQDVEEIMNTFKKVLPQ
ncbi:MAG: glycosyltransferase family 2 protein [Planctomycetes bacterium]|nr:glycosyltransferase family 2 protein [Planctomycetota bacterium]